MSLDLDALRQTALEAVQRIASEPMTHRRVDASSYNPETGSVGSPVTTETPVWGWTEPFKGGGYMFAGNSMVQMGDFKANIIAGQGVEPRAGDQLDIAGQTLTVIAVDPRPGLDLRVFDVCQVRR